VARARRDPVEIAGPARHDTWSAGASTSPLEVTSGRFSFAKSWKCASRQLGGVRAPTGHVVLQASSLSATDVRGGGGVSEIGARAETFSFKADCAQAPGAARGSRAFDLGPGRA